MQGPMQEDPTRPIFHLLALGIHVGDNANLRVCIGSARLLDTYIWVYPTQNSRNTPYANPQQKGFCVAVQYSLMGI